jgi:hypothetical protein
MQRPSRALAMGKNPHQHWREQPSRRAKSPEFLGQLLWTDRRTNMGRRKTQGVCKTKGCGKEAKSGHKCWGCYKRWDRAYGHLRCHWPDCRVHQDNGGRRMNGVFLCRRHEHEHLRITPQAHELNAQRLGHGLTADADGCWLWGGAVNDGGYGVFVPEGAGTAEWYAHRVAWGLLIGGTEPSRELDHRTCKRRNCVNPCHLEPVATSVNQRRKRQGPDWSWTNPDAAKNPRVTEFAQLHGLPLPIPKEPTRSHVVKRRRVAAFPTTNRKTPCPTSPKLPAKRGSSTRPGTTTAA